MGLHPQNTRDAHQTERPRPREGITARSIGRRTEPCTHSVCMSQRAASEKNGVGSVNSEFVATVKSHEKFLWSPISRLPLGKCAGGVIHVLTGEFLQDSAHAVQGARTVAADAPGEVHEVARPFFSWAQRSPGGAYIQFWRENGKRRENLDPPCPECRRSVRERNFPSFRRTERQAERTTRSVTADGRTFGLAAILEFGSQLGRFTSPR